jgi:hypothetical protein
MVTLISRPAFGLTSASSPADTRAPLRSKNTVDHCKKRLRSELLEDFLCPLEQPRHLVRPTRGLLTARAAQECKPVLEHAAE